MRRSFCLQGDVAINTPAEKLLKLLSLTRSENDHEALSAIRTANKIMAAHDYDWERLLGKAGSSALPPSRQQEASPPKPEVDLKAVMKNPMAYINEALAEPKFARRKGADFLRSLADYFTEKGHLTARQAEWVLKLHTEAMAARPASKDTGRKRYGA